MARRSTICTLVFVFSLSQLASALRVTPNSPCSSICRDSDANSSTTKNSDISCSDADYSSAAGTKFKNCMTCLQNSTFSQGGESDTMWFLYNLRYTVSYCVWAFPNATGIASTPCITSRACGPLEASIEDGIPNPTNTTAYSYCSSTGQGEAMNAANFANCIACISAGATTGYLANYFVALQAGCQQQPAPGVRLGLNDTVFSDNQISIVGPATNKDDRSSSKPSLSTPAIVGVVAGALVLILVVSGAIFVCLRKRRNRRARTSAEADFYSRFGQRHHSDMSFQCQTHMVSPRFWPGADEGVSIPTVEREYAQTHRSSIWKPPQDSFQAGQQTSYSDQPDGSTAYISKKAALAAVPLHQITTTVPPTAPPQAYTSPSSGGGGIVYASPSDFKSPLSADSIRSSTALLPTTIKPYVPAEHGIHTTTSSPSPTLAPASASAFNNSPTSVTGAGTGMTPLLNSQTWWPEQQQQQQQTRPSPPQEHIIKLSNPVAAAPPPPRPPPLKTSRNSGMLLGRKSPKNVGAGSPVESREIRTSFPAPPKR